MTLDEAAQLIKKHEGYSDKIYLDTVGVPTGGYGHAFLKGSPVSCYVADALFRADFSEVLENYAYLGFNLDGVRRAVVLNMLFNLGLPKFMGFKNTIASIKMGKYRDASVHMIDSIWSQQVGARSTELAQMMENGAGI